MNKGKVITFYSYKGGVGRTMSLANIATILSQWGYKVLMVDWDLEAPGLERYFMNYSSVKLSKKRGVIDLLLEKTSNNKVNWNHYLQEIKIANEHTLKFLGSGKNGSDYFDKLKQLDIDNLYEENSGFEFFEGIRDEWKLEFDYILIDSRTGVTDNGGICTIQLPDIVLVFTNTNEQSVLGTKEVIERINFSQQSQPYDRQNLIIFPILSRFDTTTEFEISQAWINKVSDTLKNVYNDWLPLKVKLKEFIEKTKIPYIPYFSFGEKLSVLEHGYSDPSSMGYAYESLASLIVNNYEDIDKFIDNRSNYINHAIKPYKLSSLIKIIGVGGGGSNAVNHMFKQGIKGVDFVICNTDTQALESSPVPAKVELGHSGGLGAGSKPEVGRNAATESIEKIKEVLTENTQMLFITAGMGGGTGTGAAPVIAKLSKEMGILTVGIVTLPFQWEGNRRSLQALEGIEEMKQYVDTLLVINNDKLRIQYGNLSVREAFAKADNVLTIAVKGIAEIITATGEVNTDFEDVKTIIKDSGKAIMGQAIAEGEDRAMRAIVEAMSSPLLNDNDINGATNILLHIVSGSDDITMDEISEITEYVQAESGHEADLIWGLGEDESLGNNIGITVIATGFKEKTTNPKSIKPTSKRSLSQTDKKVRKEDSQSSKDVKKIKKDLKPKRKE